MRVFSEWARVRELSAFGLRYAVRPDSQPASAITSDLRSAGCFDKSSGMSDRMVYISRLACKTIVWHLRRSKTAR